jgi:hypothetical protein
MIDGSYNAGMKKVIPQFANCYVRKRVRRRERERF